MLRENEYAVCIKASVRANWSLDDAISRLDFDFTRRFLPPKIFGGEDLEFLSSDELLLLNHIRGFSYAHLFLFVEEYIILQVVKQAGGHAQEPDATQALQRFAEEEVKHQRLFRAMKDRLTAELGACGELSGMTDVANFIVSKPPLPVMLLTSLLEWITQRHYLECFKDNQDLDPAFAEVFRLHWIEEAQHARLDTLEIQGLCASASPAELEAAFEVLIELIAALDDLLKQQVELDIDSLAAKRGRAFTEDERARLLADQHAAIRWTFITSGVEHRIFQRLVQDLSPTGAQRLAEAAKQYAR
ncbi:MAG: diiron oxygenase [Nannocystaceae bacterium]|nr:diiron oxygenase [Myxococcales bacterium]